MSRVMQIGAADDVFERAERALYEEAAEGRLAVKWRMGREVKERIEARAGVTFACSKPPTLYGHPVEFIGRCPPDLLELDVF